MIVYLFNKDLKPENSNFDFKKIIMNAKTELIKILGAKKIKCASITYGNFIIKEKKINLKVDYSEDQLSEFLSLLDFEYNEGFGTQELDGIVWLEDGTWLSRGEYDGSEWWNHNQLPEIPSELL